MTLITNNLSLSFKLKWDLHLELTLAVILLICIQRYLLFHGYVYLLHFNVIYGIVADDFKKSRGIQEFKSLCNSLFNLQMPVCELLRLAFIRNVENVETLF